MAQPYGQELIIDLYGCDVTKFNRKDLKLFFGKLVEEIGMTACKLTFWDDRWIWLWKILFFWDKSIQYQVLPHTKGTSAVQFIITSNVTIHALDLVAECYVNIFSCKEFDEYKAYMFIKKWFGANPKISKGVTIIRGEDSKAKS